MPICKNSIKEKDFKGESKVWYKAVKQCHGVQIVLKMFCFHSCKVILLNLIVHFCCVIMQLLYCMFILAVVAPHTFHSFCFVNQISLLDCFCFYIQGKVVDSNVPCFIVIINLRPMIFMVLWSSQSEVLLTLKCQHCQAVLSCSCFSCYLQCVTTIFVVFLLLCYVITLLQMHILFFFFDQLTECYVFIGFTAVSSYCNTAFSAQGLVATEVWAVYNTTELFLPARKAEKLKAFT